MLVRESLYGFKRKADPIASSGLGIIPLITKWLHTYNIKNYNINDDYSIDVEGDVNIFNKNISKLPAYIKFNKVKGYFYCSNNQLTSLEGCPSSIGGSFSCYNNQLTSLEGCPSSIGGSFSCYNNQLTSLEGCPSSIGGSFYCDNNQLTSLEGCPNSVGGNFYCSNNQLTSLEGCPNSVGGNFSCYNNQRKFSKEYVRSLCKVKGGITC